MTRDDITRLALEAGIRIASANDVADPRNVYAHELERFAILVAAHARREFVDRVHTCHDQCDRPICVAVREAVADRKARIEELEKITGDMADAAIETHEAVLAEREACARVCEELRDEYLENDTTIDADDFPWDALWKGAIAIRARGEKP